MARSFVTVSIALRYIYVYRDNKGGSVRGERREMVGRNCTGRGKKTCYPNGPWSDVGARLGLPRILSIHVAPSITHLIERNARNRQLDSVRYIIHSPASDIDIPGAWVICAPAKCWAICPAQRTKRCNERRIKLKRNDARSLIIYSCRATRLPASRDRRRSAIIMNHPWNFVL